jgi:hypothetical protein
MSQPHQEAAMPDKVHSGRRDDKQPQKEKKVPNLGQKEARQQQQSDSQLAQMGERSQKSRKDKDQQR